jgi:hypothetical protein
MLSCTDHFLLEIFRDNKLARPLIKNIWAKYCFTSSWLKVFVCLRIIRDYAVTSLLTIYIVAFRVIGGGNRSTRRKSPTFRKSLANFHHIMFHRVHLAINAIRNQNVSSDMHLHVAVHPLCCWSLKGLKGEGYLFPWLKENFLDLRWSRFLN